MKQCNDPEEAMHYNCDECDETCEYRKGEGNPIAFFIVFFISLLVIGKVLSLLGVW